MVVEANLKHNALVMLLSNMKNSVHTNISDVALTYVDMLRIARTMIYMHMLMYDTNKYYMHK